MEMTSMTSIAPDTKNMINFFKPPSCVGKDLSEWAVKCVLWDWGEMTYGDSLFDAIEIR